MHNHEMMNMGNGPNGSCCTTVMQMNMQMYFTTSSNVTLLFESWTTRSVPQYVASLSAVAVMAFVYEMLFSAKPGLIGWVNKRMTQSRNHSLQRKSSSEHLLSDPGVMAIPRTRRIGARFANAGLRVLQMFYAYMLMLLVMTYNVGVMLAVFFGTFVGYVIFVGDSSPAVPSSGCHE